MAAARVRALVVLALVAVLLEDSVAAAASDVGAPQCLSEERGSARGALLLQVRSDIQVKHSNSRKKGFGDACDADSAEFSATRCHELTLGVSEPRQLLEASPRAFDLALVSERSRACARTFHALSLAEAEQLQPSLKSCLVSTWAAKMYQSLSTSPCARSSPASADLVVLPGYTAVECNWPIYGGGVCLNRKDGLVNYARVGLTCRGSDTLQAFRQIQLSLNKQVVVLENSPNPRGNKYDLPDSSIYAEPKMSWAFVGTEAGHYRLGADVSLPPGPSLRCRLSDPTSRSARSFSEPLESKTYLASFKGGLGMHPFRLTAKAALHDGKRIIIADTSDATWDFDDLLFSSVFALILRGDDIMTTRVNEAVCSGGIPVLVTDVWVPPFNETVPFQTFGLVHDERQVGTLKDRLEKVSSAERARLRTEAQKACKGSFQTIEMHAATLGQALSQLTVAGKPAS